MQFFEVDLPQVSQKKIDLVDAVIPDKQKVLILLQIPVHDLKRLRCIAGGVLGGLADLCVSESC